MRQAGDTADAGAEAVRLQMPKQRGRTRRYYSVGEVAAVFGVSSMTVYRALAAGEFPAVKIRSRYVIPIRAVEEMEAAAAEGTVVDAADWMPQAQ